jgi:ABC-type transport system involved in multi-copper enzyme maturation permease subunit
MIIWRNLFDNPVDMVQVFNSVGVLLFHIALFLFISWFHFNRKDIYS